jgi:hypothetical protein
MTRTPEDDRIVELIEAWKNASPAPPEHLEERVLRAVRAEHEATVAAQTDRATADAGERGFGTAGSRHPARRWYHPSSWSPPAWAAAGALATLLVVAALLSLRAATFVSAPARADRLLVADALRDAETAEREHARAIARLQEAAEPILVKARDPQLSGEHAARLMMLANRLRFLDQTIAEIRGFLQENPSHPGARSTLLAAYSEKTDVLRDVIALDEEITS